MIDSMKDKELNTLTITLSEAFATTAVAFRLGQEAKASKQFRECINLLERILKTHCNAPKIITILPEMLAAQERQDWLSLADYIEYELPILLKN